MVGRVARMPAFKSEAGVATQNVRFCPLADMSKEAFNVRFRG